MNPRYKLDLVLFAGAVASRSGPGHITGSENIRSFSWCLFPRSKPPSLQVYCAGEVLIDALSRYSPFLLHSVLMTLDNGSHSDSSFSSEDLIGQLKKLSVASTEQSSSTVCIKKKISSLKFVQKLEHVGVYSFCFEGCGLSERLHGLGCHELNSREESQDHFHPTEVFALVAPVLRISAAAKLLALENPRASLLWDPSKPTPKFVGLEVEADKPGGHSCKLLLPLRFLDLQQREENLEPAPSSQSEQRNSFAPAAHGKGSATSSKGFSSSTSSTRVGSVKSLFFKADPRLLKEPDLRQKVHDIWCKHKGDGQLRVPQDFFAAWRQVRGVVKDAQYQESQELSTLDVKRKQLSQLGNLGMLSPDQLQTYGTLADEVRRLDAIQHHKFCLWSREKFLAFGDSNSRYFLSKFKRRSAHCTLKSLQRDDGSVLVSQTDITKEVYNFYEQLYQEPQSSDDALRDREKLLGILRSAPLPW
ncbi:hypothetical protein R1sor_001513 [Riccia sorocarpa]|uniref:Uncharacterized protein n=1 Tax=Riccia sorocarpa TaxID=122646 RepID=A0ABD3GY40_9MARC